MPVSYAVLGIRPYKARSRTKISQNAVTCVAHTTHFKTLCFCRLPMQEGSAFGLGNFAGQTS